MTLEGEQLLSCQDVPHSGGRIPAACQEALPEGLLRRARLGLCLGGRLFLLSPRAGDLSGLGVLIGLAESQEDDRCQDGGQAQSSGQEKRPAPEARRSLGLLPGPAALRLAQQGDQIEHPPVLGIRVFLRLLVYHTFPPRWMRSHWRLSTHSS